MRRILLFEMLTVFIVMGAAPGTGGSSHAAEDPDALIQRGIELRRKGQDDAALVEFRRAYALAKTPRAAAQLGFAEQATGDWAVAEAHVQEALAADTDPWVVKNRSTIEGALRTIEQHTARVDILGGVDGADVEVNGRSVGTLPLHESIRVSAGAVNIVVRAKGYRPGVRTVTVTGNERTKVHFLLEANEGLAVPPSGNGGADALISSPQPLPADALAARNRQLRYAGIGIGAGGVALVAAGVACMIVRNNKLDGLEAGAAAGRPYVESNGDWKTFQTASVVLYVAGGAAIIGGAATFFMGRRSSNEERGTVTSLFVSPSGSGAVVSGRF